MVPPMDLLSQEKADSIDLGVKHFLICAKLRHKSTQSWISKNVVIAFRCSQLLFV